MKKEDKIEGLTSDANKISAGWEKLSKVYAENTLNAQVEVAPEVWEARKAFVEDNMETAAGFMDHKDPTVPKIISDGTNTRIVDRCIQEYFTYGVTYIYRGRERKHRYLTQRVFGIFDDRMEREHREELYQAIYCSVDDIWCFKVTKMR